MEILTTAQTLTLISFALPFLLILVFSIVYAINLKKDNDFIRAQLSACRESMGNERQIHKSTVEALKTVRENLRKANMKILSNPDPNPPIIATSPLMILKFTLREFESETIGSKAAGLKKLQETVGEMVLGAAKHTKKRIIL
jgi:hypothetical protein